MRDGVVDIYVHVLCENVENSVVIFRSCFGFFLERLSLSLSSFSLSLILHRLACPVYTDLCVSVCWVMDDKDDDDDDDLVFTDMDDYARRLIQQPYSHRNSTNAYTRNQEEEEEEGEEEEEEEGEGEEGEEEVKLMSPRHAEALGTLHSLVDGAAQLRVHLAQLGHELERAGAADTAATGSGVSGNVGVDVSPVSSGEAWSELLRLQRGLQRVESSVNRSTRETERRAVREERERVRLRRRWEQMKMEEEENHEAGILHGETAAEDYTTNSGMIDNGVGGDVVENDDDVDDDDDDDDDDAIREGTYDEERKSEYSANLLSLTRMRYPSYRVRASSLSSDALDAVAVTPPPSRQNEENEEERDDGFRFPVEATPNVGHGYAHEDRVDNYEIHVPRVTSPRLRYDYENDDDASRANLPPSRSYAYEASGTDDGTYSRPYRGEETSSTASEDTADGRNDRRSGASRITSAIAGGVCVCVAGALRRPGAAVGMLLLVTRAVGRARRGSRPHRGRRRGVLNVLRGRG